MKKPDCYIGIKPCGCVVAWVRIDEYPKETARAVSDMIRNGYRIESAVTDEVRHKLKRCQCQMELIP